ncbi:hypothetical protein OAF17_03575, partial [Akkermansiaceae bacterium]|nr:hypothetical protein [Akkermansiaceae bacterium]
LAGSAGNALEVADAISFLRGEGERSRLETVVMSLSAELLVLGGLAADRDEAKRNLKSALDTGKAAEVFSKMVAGLGGPSDLVERPSEYLPVAPIRRDVTGTHDGWVQKIDTRELGITVLELGGGRTRAEDAIDYSVGLSGIAELGQRIGKGDLLAQVHAQSEDDFALAQAKIRKAVTISEEQASGQPVVYELVS